MLKDLVLKNRSTRRYQPVEIKRETLVELVDLARNTASSANRQPLKFILSCEPEKNALIFPQLSWAGHLKSWSPPEGERPSAYIIVLGDTRLTQSFSCDHGIAAQTILLGATEKGLAGCMLGAIKKDGLRQSLGIAPHFEILLVIALGKPKEKIVLETMAPGADFKYWRDEAGVHHVPKRSLEEIIIG